MLLNSDVVKGGMIPKLEACVRALETSPVTDIVDGREPGALLKCLGRGWRRHPHRCIGECRRFVLGLWRRHFSLPWQA